MAAGKYALHYHSLVRWTKQETAAIAAELGIAVPAYVNLDAHGQEEELPRTNIVGTQGYAMTDEPAALSLFMSWTISTWDDPDLVLMTDLADRLAQRLAPSSTIPIWTAGSPSPIETSWMVVAGDLDVDPLERGTTRSFVSLSVRLLSGLTGSP